MEQTNNEIPQENIPVEAQVDIAACKKDFSRVGLWFFLGALLINGLQIAVMIAYKKLLPDTMKNGNLEFLVNMLPGYLIAMPLMIYFLSRLPKVEPERHQMKWWQFLATLPMGYSILIASNIVGLIITGIIGAFKGSNVNNVLVEVVTSISPWLRVVVMVICAPIFEELIFRKMLVTRTLKYGQGVAVVLSGLMFGFFHGNLNQFAYAFCLGMFFAFLYVKTGNIKITIGLHMFINFIGGVFGGWLLDLLDIQELMKLTGVKPDSPEYINYVTEHLFGFIVYFIFILFVGAMVVAGIVLFILGRKRFVLEKGQVQLPKGQRFKTVILNPGMILYCLFWTAMIIAQLIL